MTNHTDAHGQGRGDGDGHGDDAGKHDPDSARPTATAPDSVSGSVPQAARDAGQLGSDAADPPRAARKAEQAEDGPSARDAGGDPELDANEGADAFETRDEAEQSARSASTDRRDEDQITIDPPD
ncbi:hypothetical protein MUN77_00175 [Leucobacter allii]|uniref:hypothetical protein n=1 Tax=Leucobacter allii TaxID=2932247 RepID=UPI001FD629AB|nr:hypothetical protein [Leucobacter allii]UOR01781.1 hypothetical protein MUN77_00175 [Leucobacter allii]